jgi:hypothetical protein
MGDLNSKVAADSQGSLHFKCLFLHLLILSVVFHTFLKIKTSNTKYTLMNRSIHLFRMFQEIPPLFTQLSSRYYHQYLDILDEGQSPLPDVIVQEMYLFLAIFVRMGHNQKDNLKNY